MEWEKELEAWEAKYQPIKNHITDENDDKFETYGEELNYVRSIVDTEPRRVWTLVDGEDGNLYIVDGYHLVNRLNYFITKKPLEGNGFLEVPYYIFDEVEETEE
jgi:hypothetical protein